jgi:predicted RNA-binding protein with RPS1 domain
MDDGDYGHVNITEIGSEAIRGPEDFPPVGSEVVAVVLGYAGDYDQLRLSLKAAT